MTLDEYLTLLCRQPHADVDVAEVALLLARDEYPQLDVEASLAEVAGMAHEARSYVRGDIEARAHGLCRYLFHEMGYHGNTKDYYDPGNSYLNLVMERRTGIPITLSALTMAVGRRAGLSVQGVGLPGHFIVKVVSPEQQVLLDPFHGGRRLETTDCENLVKQVTGMPFEASPLNLTAAPLGWMFVRMLANLKGIYLAAEDYGRAIRVMQRMMQLQPEEASLQRDLGVAWMRVGKPGKAIDLLEYYLRQVGDQASDAKMIAPLLREARTSVARLN
jgi:regulator of sirC expression with transglutaminase-like and TPR domain